jgi:hypothetical protein
VKVFILDHTAAKGFIPDKETLAIRIYDSPVIYKDSSVGNHAGSLLQPNKNWIHTLEYLFDDIELNRYSPEYIKEKLPEWNSKFKIFDKALAKKIITDFTNYCDVEQVMIHCTWGWARSPATILALQKVFDLDIEWAKGRTQRVIDAKKVLGNPGNTYVYNLITEV